MALDSYLDPSWPTPHFRCEARQWWTAMQGQLQHWATGDFNNTLFSSFPSEPNFRDFGSSLGSGFFLNQSSATPRFVRIVSPLDSRKWVFLCRLNDSDPNPAGGANRQRCEITSSSPQVHRLSLSTPYLAAQAVWIPDAMRSQPAGQWSILWQLFPPTSGNPNLTTELIGGGGTPANAKLRTKFRTLLNGLGTSQPQIERDLANGTDWSADRFQYIVYRVDLRQSYSASGIQEIWIADGETAEPRSIGRYIGTTAGNTWAGADDKKPYSKAGLYKGDGPYSFGEETVYHKGLVVWPDTGVMSPRDCIEYMRRI